MNILKSLVEYFAFDFIEIFSNDNNCLKLEVFDTLTD